MLLGDVLHVRVAGAVDAMHPDARFHAGIANGLDGVLPAARKFVVPVQPVLGTTAVALLVRVIELHVVIAEIGQVLFDEQRQHRVECFLGEAVTIRPPGAVARKRAFPDLVGPGFEVLVPVVSLVEPRAEDDLEACSPLHLDANVRLSSSSISGVIRVLPSAGTDQHPIPTAIVDGVVPQVSAQPTLLRTYGKRCCASDSVSAGNASRCP
jgi:hypothetical protein